MRPDCPDCGALCAAFCLMCDGFQTIRHGPATFCAECDQVTYCPCAFVYDEVGAITTPYMDVAWWIAGFPTNEEFPRALSEEAVEKMRKAGVDLDDDFEIGFFLAHGRLPEPSDFPDE